MRADSRHPTSDPADIPEEQADLAAELFRMLADATRIRMLWLLIHRELSVNEIAALVGKPAPSVSQHLAKLRLARLVQTRRDGNHVIYRVENEHVAQLVVDAVQNAEHAGPGVPSHHRDDALVLAPARVVDAPATSRRRRSRAK